MNCSAGSSRCGQGEDGWDSRALQSSAAGYPSRRGCLSLGRACAYEERDGLQRLSRSAVKAEASLERGGHNH